uniref:Uncharacterized protein n=1 Tax=Parascaris univalens TaxID=6257 RepID=A0A914ZVK6_PARUN
SPLRKFGKFICSFWLTGKICDYCIFQSIGGRSSQTNETRMPVYLTHLPGGTSTANLVHWAQLTTTGRLRMYDFGSEHANMQRYGTPIPPAYEFRNISTPLYVYWSDADWLTDPR